MTEREITKAANLAKEIIKEIPSNNQSTPDYEVALGCFNDPRKNVYLVRSKEITETFKKPIAKNICFRTLWHDLQQGNPNRVYMRIEDCKKVQVEITSKEKKQWIKLAQKHGFLPKYIRQFWVSKGEYVVNLDDKNMCPSLLYSYLSVIRCIRDEPAFVKSILIMTNQGVNYYLAFTLASSIYITNSGHHIVDISKGYPNRAVRSYEAFLKVGLNVGMAIALKRYFDNPRKWDGRHVPRRQDETTKLTWNCHDTIRSAAEYVKVEIKASRLYDPSVVKAVMSNGGKKVELG